MRSMTVWILAAGVVASTAACGGDEARSTDQAATPGSTSGAPVATSGTATAGESTLIQDQLGLARKQQGLAQLAAERATRPEVKALAESIVREHDATYGPLQQIAERQSVRVADPEQLRIERERLSKLSGAGFDREYLVEIIADHERAITGLQDAARSSDAQVKEWATAALPRIQRHLEEAQRLHGGTTPSR
jgi:putative membrane protein